MRLKHKLVFLTGGSTGIGFHCAAAYAREGAKVVIVALDEAESSAAARKLGDGHIGFACNIAKDAEVKAAIERTLAAYGRIDVIHNNAGVASPSKPLHETSDAEWDLLMDVNLRGVLHTTRHGLDALRASKGNILNTSSLVGVIGQSLHAAYTATKGALKMLTKGMAAELGPHGITVNGIGPGYIKTELTQALVDDPAFSGWLVNRTPARRWGDVEDLVGAAIFLSSDASRFVNGHILYVDGGVTATL